jgi:hypothetical protein
MHHAVAAFAHDRHSLGSTTLCTGPTGSQRFRGALGHTVTFARL